MRAAQSATAEIRVRLKDGTIIKAFKDIGRFSKLMGEIPVKVIMNDKTALLGAFSYALSCQRRKIEPGDWHLT